MWKYAMMIWRMLLAMPVVLAYEMIAQFSGIAAVLVFMGLRVWSMGSAAITWRRDGAWR